MKDLFGPPIKVYYWPGADNLVLLNPPTLFMLATMEGSNGRKLCVVEEDAIKWYGLIYVGDFE